MCTVRVEREEPSSCVMEPATVVPNCQHKILVLDPFMDHFRSSVQYLLNFKLICV